MAPNNGQQVVRITRSGPNTGDEVLETFDGSVYSKPFGHGMPSGVRKAKSMDEWMELERNRRELRVTVAGSWSGTGFR